MSVNIIENMYEAGPRHELLLKEVPQLELLSALTDFLKRQVEGKPDWETIAFAGRQTWHLDQVAVEAALGSFLAEHKGSAIAWGVVGWFLRLYWAKRDHVDHGLVSGMVASMGLGIVPGYMPDGPVCAIGTIITQVGDSAARTALAGKTIAFASKASLCSAAKTHLEHIKKSQ